VNHKVFQQAIDKFGFDNQVDKCIEECAELIDALMKYRQDRVIKNRVLEEVAGVNITTTQVLMMMDPDDEFYSKIENEQVKKLKRHVDAVGEMEHPDFQIDEIKCNTSEINKTCFESGTFTYKVRRDK